MIAPEGTKHFYAVIFPAAKTNALTKGRETHNQPPWNISHRYSIDGKTLLVEGLFTQEEVEWFEKQSTIFDDAEAAREYIRANHKDWEADNIEE